MYAKVKYKEDINNKKSCCECSSDKSDNDKTSEQETTEKVVGY